MDGNYYVGYWCYSGVMENEMEGVRYRDCISS